MSNETELLVAYRARYIEHKLTAAINYLANAAVDAARAHDGLHWLSGARANLQHAKEEIAIFEAFITALDAGDTDALAKLNADHEAALIKALSDPRRDELEAVLEDCAEFIDGQVDVVDGDYGEPEPNKAMRLMTAIREVLPA